MNLQTRTLPYLLPYFFRKIISKNKRSIAKVPYLPERDSGYRMINMYPCSTLGVKSLSLLCASLLLLCGSLSLFCPMVAQSADTATHATHHGMDDPGECFEVFISSSSLPDEVNDTILLPENSQGVCLRKQATYAHLNPVPSYSRGDGPPRYLLLSTFLI